ncbi:MAG: tetratricopeptide repeat protein, partial [Candidatus Tectomicrobia bacterium]|nr:tetratricopeptide repeat protein [Candidatus Tectomicrobia bacterium]
EAPEVHAARAHYHMVRGEWTQGRAVLQHFTATHPQCPAGWRYSAQWHARSGDIETASSAIQHAYELAPHDAETVLAAGAIRLDAGHLSALRPLIDEMRQDFADDWRLQTMAGYALMQTGGDAERACALSARGPQLQPHLPQAWFRYGQTLALCSRRQEAIDAFQEGWKGLPQQDGETLSTPAALWLGESYDALGDDTSAHMWWEEAQRLASRLITKRSALGHYWLGKAWSALERPDLARRALQTALRQHLFYPARQDAITLLAAQSKDGLRSTANPYQR